MLKTKQVPQNKIRYPRAGRLFNYWLKSHYSSAEAFAKQSHIRLSVVYSYLGGRFKPTAMTVYKMLSNTRMTPKLVHKIFGSRKRTFGTYVKLLRYERGISTIKMGRLLGNGQRGISRMESAISTPLPRTLRQIAHVFKMEPSQLWYGYQEFLSHDKLTLGIYLHAKLLDSPYSATQVNKMCNTGSDTLQAIIKGHRKPTIKNLFCLSKVFNIDILVLFRLAGYPSSYLGTYGSRLMAVMTQDKISRRYLAHRLGCTRQCISNYVLGRTHPSKETKQQIKRALGA